jgi:hypothetical protein
MIVEIENETEVKLAGTKRRLEQGNKVETPTKKKRKMERGDAQVSDNYSGDVIEID